VRDNAKDSKLFEVDANGDYVFGSKIKNLFKSVAQKLVDFHKSGCYYGNLFHGVSIILPELFPVFRYPPKQANRAELVNGIKDDVMHFRRMVAHVLLSSGIKIQDFSIDFELFFSKIFTREMGGS
jgi:hypothetical protein